MSFFNTGKLFFLSNDKEYEDLALLVNIILILTNLNVALKAFIALMSFFVEQLNARRGQLTMQSKVQFFLRMVDTWGFKIFLK